MDTWQPIETAPKDGTRILLFRATAYCTLHIVVGRWNEDEKHETPKPYWSHDAESVYGVKEARKFQPTHWMPLPNQPGVEGVQAERPKTGGKVLALELVQVGRSHFHRDRR